MKSIDEMTAPEVAEACKSALRQLSLTDQLEIMNDPTPSIGDCAATRHAKELYRRSLELRGIIPGKDGSPFHHPV